MAQLLYTHYESQGQTPVESSDPNETRYREDFARYMSSYDVATRKLTTSGPKSILYMGGYNGAPAPPEDYSWPTDVALDAYTVPSEPTAPGYDATAVGKYRTVYHDGTGGLTFEDGESCDIAVKNIVGRAPSAVGGLGSVEFEVSTTAVWVSAYVVTLTAAEVGTSLLQVAPGKLAIASVPAGSYRLMLSDARGCALGISPELLVTVPAAPPLVVRGCMDEEAGNYNSLATEDDGTCRYAPRWVGVWSPEGVTVTVAPTGDPLPAYLSAELQAGYPVGHPLAAVRPLVSVATLRATVAPSGLATFDLAPYLRSELGGMHAGTRRLDINSADAYTADLYVGFKLLLSGSVVASGYALNSALEEVQLEQLRVNQLPLTPFGKLLPVWANYPYLLSVLHEDNTGRLGTLETRSPANDASHGVRVVNLPCPRYGLPVAWLSPEGSFGYWVFAGHHAVGDEVGEGQPYLEGGTQELRYSSRAASRQVVEATSGVFSQRAFARGLRTLRRSVQAWYQPEGPGTAWVPITLKGGSFPAYREGRSRYEVTIQFTEAKAVAVQGQ